MTPSTVPIRPRVVIGAPLYGKAGYLSSAVDSLLRQTFEDFALLLIDDRSPDDTATIAARYADADPRVVFESNPERLGMLHNTRKAFLRARELFPSAPYWALASDHDIWEPEWLERLVEELETHPECVAAYPHTRRIGAEGEVLRGPWSFDTRDLADPRERFQAAFRGMVAGDMIYSLFRAEAFGRVGPYRSVLVPDRLLLTELAWHGTFRQVPEVLWSRRFRGLADLDRQRAAFFPDGVPPSAKAPWWFAHVWTLFEVYAIRGEGRPEIGRGTGAALSADYLRLSLQLRARRRFNRAKKNAQRALKRNRRRMPRGLLSSKRANRVRRHVAAVPARALSPLLRKPATRALLSERIAPGLLYVADVLERARRDYEDHDLRRRPS